MIWRHVSGSDEDVIDPSALQAVSGADRPFSLIGAETCSGAAGELHAVKSGSYTLVEGDVIGDGATGSQTLLRSVPAFKESDFVRTAARERRPEVVEARAWHGR